MPLLALLACTRPDLPAPDPPSVDEELLRTELTALPHREGSQPTIVLIVLDTFRADRLAAWGGEGLTPNLDAWGQQSAVYTGMQSVSSWTLPAHASLFTGHWPRRHGAEGSPPTQPGQAGRPLGPELPTLAERLRDEGWLTVGIAANRGFLNKGWGLDRGFQLWLCSALEPASPSQNYVPADRMVAMAQQVLEDREDEPLFLFLNFMDTHTPWLTRAGFGDPPRDPDLLLDPEGRATRWKTVRGEVLRGERLPTELELQVWGEAYDAEVRWLDHQLGGLLKTLEGRDLYTVLLSDHGEFLGEHGLLEHSKALYSEVTQVPLMIRGPGFSPGLDPTPVQTADVPNLLLAALGLPVLTQEKTEDLLVSELYWARRKERSDPVLRARFDHIQRSYTVDGHRLIEHSSLEAYDLDLDPRETTSVPEAPWVPELQTRAAAWRASTLEGPETRSTGGDDEVLQALGYIE